MDSNEGKATEMSPARRVSNLAVTASLAAAAILGSTAAPAAARTADLASTASTGTNAESATHYPVSVQDMSIQTGWTYLPAGKVVFDIQNTGAITHEIVVLRTTALQNAIPADPTNAARVMEVGSIGEADDIAPGRSASLPLTLTPGRYVLICNEPGHYKAGMHVGFTVATYVNATVDEMSISLDKTSIPYGPVVFNATSTGAIEHELVLLKTGALPENVPLGADKRASEDNDIFEIDPVLPGKFSAGTIDLAPGWYILICNKPGHFLAGMRTRFEVTGTEVNVSLKEMALQPDTTVVPAGLVDFNVQNDGTVTHELVVVKTSVADGELPAGDEAGKVSEAGWVGETGDMAAHTFNGLELYLRPGTYEVMCNEPGHYQAGMHFLLTVQ